MQEGERAGVSERACQAPPRLSLIFNWGGGPPTRPNTAPTPAASIAYNPDSAPVSPYMCPMHTLQPDPTADAPDGHHRRGILGSAQSTGVWSRASRNQRGTATFTTYPYHRCNSAVFCLFVVCYDTFHPHTPRPRHAVMVAVT